MPFSGRQSAAVVSIYDAANDSDGWNNSLDVCVDYVQAHSANIMFHENERDSRWRYTLGSHRWRACSPEQMARTISMFQKYDTKAWAFVHSQRKQKVLIDTDFWTDPAEIEHREDYEFFRELGFTRKAGAKLNDNLCWTDNLAFQFASDLKEIPQDSIARIQHLLPHAAKSIELWRTFSILKSQYKAVLSALDHVRIGLCIAQPDGTIIVTNDEADRVLDLGSSIRLGKDKHIHCRSKTIEGTIREAIHKSCATSAGDTSITEAYQLLGNDNDTQISVEIAPLRDSGGEIASHFNGALITLVDLSTDLEVDCSKVATAYKLSPSEEQVYQQLTIGASVSEIADSRNVTPETIKSQLKSIYRKTSCKSRVGLIRLAIKASPPIK